MKKKEPANPKKGLTDKELIEVYESGEIDMVKELKIILAAKPTAVKSEKQTKKQTKE